MNGLWIPPSLASASSGAAQPAEPRTRRWGRGAVWFTLSLCCLLAASLRLHADPIAIGQFAIEFPSAESVGYYGFTVANLTGNSTSGACTDEYPVCTDTPLIFENPTLTVDYGYAQIDGNGNIIAGTLTDQGTYSATAQDADAFDPAYNGCGVYGVDGTCAGTSDDTVDAFQVPLPEEDGAGDTLVILEATFSTTVAPVDTNLGEISGTYTAVMFPPTDCAGPCNFLDPGLYGGDPYVGDWEYYDYQDITGPGPTQITQVPEPSSFWLLAPFLALFLGWRALGQAFERAYCIGSDSRGNR